MSAGSWKRAKEFRRQDTPEDEASGEEEVESFRFDYGYGYDYEIRHFCAKRTPYADAISY